MKAQIPGTVKMVVKNTRQDFEQEVQRLVDDGYVPFSSMAEGERGWSIMMMKTKIVEIDNETGLPVETKNEKGDS